MKRTIMLWVLISLFFFWLVYRELTGNMPISKGYLLVVFSLALLCAWPPYHHWHFERFLTSIAGELAENHPAKVHCNTLFDTLFDEEPRIYGHADPQTGYIVIQYPRCSILMDYVRQTECEAVQRNYRTAKLLGVPDNIAKQNALDYYNRYYLQRNDGYFSKECAPGKALDEHLSDSTWDE